MTQQTEEQGYARLVKQLLEVITKQQNTLADLANDYELLKQRVIILESRGPGTSKGW